MSRKGSMPKRRVGDNEANAIASMLRISPQKLNVVVAMIRGRKVSDALTDLEFSRKRIAGDVKKTLRSAIANAENNHDLDVDRLIVSEAYVGKSVSMKRFHCRGRQRIGRIVRPFSRLTVIVREVSDEGKVV
ncbi:50S ribosomal protein L22 [Candidatus Liberibacter brunswickensis]|uniref:50S ribosomal protein L22 n=1 Tax=Candidatus Liberibacter brunswickensis TaxID=1968796 RepID=UPI002FE2B75C